MKQVSGRVIAINSGANISRVYPSVEYVSQKFGFSMNDILMAIDGGSELGGWTFDWLAGEKGGYEE